MPGRVAAAIIALQALGCAVLAVAFPVAAAHDPGLSTASHVMFSVFAGLFAAGLGFVARGLWRGQSWPRTASLVWLVVLLPVAWTMVQSGWRLPGWLILGSSLVAMVAVAAESRRTPT
jgi:peptidoglycan/LPS O-acetylase OafA/YrhL